MKKFMYLILIALCFICTSCNQIVPDFKEGNGDGGTESTPIMPEDEYDVLPELEYNEAPDSVEGIDVTDLSGLKEAVDKIGNNYASRTKVFFNKLAVDRVIYNYKKPFYCQVTSYYAANYVYRYNQTLEVNEGYLNYNNNLYTVNLVGDSLVDRLISGITADSLNLYKENQSVADEFFTLDELNSEYIDKYGPTTVDYGKNYKVDYEGWTRISENKYKCDREEVILDFLNICSPGFDNGGTYMTFRYVTVEVNEDGTVRLRLYASPTQIGKLIQTHKNPDNTNWYLLFAEAEIYDINKIETSAFENFYNR